MIIDKGKPRIEIPVTSQWHFAVVAGLAMLIERYMALKHRSHLTGFDLQFRGKHYRHMRRHHRNTAVLSMGFVFGREASIPDMGVVILETSVSSYWGSSLIVSLELPLSA